MKILISGTGSIGQRHVRNLRSLGVENISVCDPNKENREACSCPAYEDLTTALTEAKPEIVFICSPSKFHIPQALEAASAGAHVFIEKPLSNTTEGIDELKHVVEEKNLICMIGCNMQFHHGPSNVKKLLDKGIIGEVQEATVYTGSYLPNWRPHQDYKKSYSADPKQGGAVLDSIHEIDLALWFFGPATLEDAKLQKADSIGIEVEGTADLKLKHQTFTSDVHLSFMEKDYERFCSIKGTHGSIDWDINEKTVELRDKSGSIMERIREPSDYDINQMYVDEVQYFLKCVEKETRPQGNLDEAIAALTIALGARG